MTGLAGSEGGGLNLDSDDADGNEEEVEWPTVARVEKLILLELLLACLEDLRGCGCDFWSSWVLGLCAVFSGGWRVKVRYKAAIAMRCGGYSKQSSERYVSLIIDQAACNADSESTSCP